MKNIILVIALLFNCKGENQFVDNSFTQDAEQIKYYDLIFNEIEKIDLDKFYINYQIDKEFVITDDIIKSLSISKVIKTNEVKNLSYHKIDSDYSKELSQKNANLILSSKTDNSSKIEIYYTFSEPYKIRQDIVLIFNRIEYRNNNKSKSKGGSERVFMFKKTVNNWKIVKTKNLIDI